MEAITRKEKILSGENLVPYTRLEAFLKNAVKKAPNPSISFKEFVEGTLEEFKSDYVKTIEAYSFYKLTSLKKVVLGVVNKIEAKAFDGCTALETIVLENENEMCTLDNNNAFTSTLIASGTGSIYVPAHLLEAYKNDEKWSVYNSCIKAFGEVEKIVGGGDKIHLYSEEITAINSKVLNFDDTVESIDFPNCTYVCLNAFSHNKGIKKASYANMTTLYRDACPKNCEEFYAPKVTATEDNAFTMKPKLRQISFPLLTALGTRTGWCQACYSLVSVNLPSLTALIGQDFNKCYSLIDVHIPLVTNIGYASFNSCSSLEQLDLPNVVTIDNLAFKGASSLKILVLRKEDNVCSLVNIRAFEGTSYANGGTGGVVLVPSALVETYQTATNWATLYGYGTCEFLPLEEYTIDGTTTGEIDWDKLNNR